MIRSVAAVALVYIVGCFGASGPTSSGGPFSPVLSQRIRIDESLLDLGEVAVTDFETTLQLQNITSTGIMIDQLAGDCSCVSVSPENLRIDGGGVASITVRLRLSGKPGPFSIRLTGREGATGATAEWRVRGKLISLFDSPAEAFNVALNYPTKVIQIEQKLSEPIIDATVHLDPMIGVATSRLNGSVLLTSFEIADSCEFGRVQSAVRVLGKRLNGDTIDMKLPLYLTRLPPYSTYPAVVNLGEIVSGKEVRGSFEIHFKATPEHLTIEAVPPHSVLRRIAHEELHPDSLRVRIAFALVAKRQGPGTVAIAAQVGVANTRFRILVPISYRVR